MSRILVTGSTTGIGHSDQTLHSGTYDATEAELARFEGRETTVEVVEQTRSAPPDRIHRIREGEP